MAIAGDGADRTTRRIRRIARIWSAVIIGFTLFMIIAHVVVPDTNPADYPPSENLLPLAMCLSVAGLGVAWRWEGLGGAINCDTAPRRGQTCIPQVLSPNSIWISY
jgi:hypothetical protein